MFLASQPLSFVSTLYIQNQVTLKQTSLQFDDPTGCCEHKHFHLGSGLVMLAGVCNTVSLILACSTVDAMNTIMQCK